MKKKFIPVSKPYISKKDIISINKVIKKGWISSDGPEVKNLKRLFQKSLIENFQSQFQMELLL